MAMTEYASGSATISTSEYSLVNDSTTIATETADGIYQLFLDPTAMLAGDTFEVALREKVRSVDGQERKVLATLSGAQTELWTSDAFQLMHGWDFTIDRTAGTDRSFQWSVRRVA